MPVPNEVIKTEGPLDFKLAGRYHRPNIGGQYFNGRMESGSEPVSKSSSNSQYMGQIMGPFQQPVNRVSDSYYLWGWCNFLIYRTS